MSTTKSKSDVHFFNKRRDTYRFLLWFSLANVCIFLLVGTRYLSVLLSSKTLFVTTAYSYSTLIEKLTVYLFTITSFIGHFSLLAFLPLICLISPLILLFKRHNAIIIASIFIASLSVAILIIDSIIFSLYHFHLNITVLKVALAERSHFKQFFNLSSFEFAAIFVLSATLITTETCLAIFVWRSIVKKNRWLHEGKIILFLVLNLCMSYLGLLLTMAASNNVFAQQTPNFPLYNNILASILPIKNSFSLLERYSETRFSQPLFPVATLNYPLHELTFTPHNKPLNIVIIGIDSWRFDALNNKLTPNIEKFAAHAWKFTQHFSGGNSTQPGLFSLFYSLPSNYWTSMLEQEQGAILIHELLKHGYETKVSFSADMHVPPFKNTIFTEVNNIRTDIAPGETIPDHDRATTNEFIHSIMTRNKHKPFFGFVFYDAAHGYCGEQNIPQLYATSNSNCDRLLSTNQFKTTDLINRYKNAVHFIDDQIKQVLITLTNQHMLDNTIIIVTGDHGEEFNDTKQNYWGHGGNFTHYQLQTPLVIYWPHQPAKTWTQQTSHYDIAPLLMEKALGCRNPISDYSIGHDLFSTQDRSYLLVGSYINMGIVEKNRSMTLLTSGNIRIADDEGNDIPNAKPDMTALTDALFDMRKYYARDTA